MKITWIEKYLAEVENMVPNDRVDEGLDLLNSLLYDEPGYASLHNYLGWTYLYYTDDETLAENHLKVATKFDSKYSPPYLHLGALYIKQTRYSDAILWSTNGLANCKNNRVGVLQNLANAHELRKDWHPAINA